MPITQVSIVKTAARYPSLTPGEVPFGTYNSIKLLWDTLSSTQDRLVAAEATITRLITLTNSLETQFTAARKAADEALGIRQEI